MIKFEITATTARAMAFNAAGEMVEVWERDHDGTMSGLRRALAWAGKWARFHAR